MGQLSEFSLPVRLLLKSYRWRRIDPVPWTPLRKPLAQCHVAIVSSAGVVLPGQEPFSKTPRGDTNFREIPADADLKALRDTHRSGSFDHRGMNQDPNLVFPLDRLRELAEARRIGSVNRRHLSFMGSIPAPGLLIRDSAPAAAQLPVQDRGDAPLLGAGLPVC